MGSSEQQDPMTCIRRGQTETKAKLMPKVSESHERSKKGQTWIDSPEQLKICQSDEMLAGLILGERDVVSLVGQFLCTAEFSYATEHGTYFVQSRTVDEYL